jgi:hypothetical protein
VARALAAAGLLALLFTPAPLQALNETDIAGELNGEAVTLAETQPPPGVDGRSFARHALRVHSYRCAVREAADAEESLRLGFGEMIPSWVIGRRPRRGFQGDEVLDATIEAEQAPR